MFICIFLILISYSYSQPQPFQPTQSTYPNLTCIDLPPSSYPKCAESQIMAIIMHSYNVGQPYNDLNIVDIYCNNAQELSGDGFLLCSGNLPYDATNMISFSGTRNIQDMLYDADFFPTLNNETGIQMETFSGFNDEFYKWKPTVDSFFPNCNASTGLIIVSGHSLGGATAHITGLYLAGKGCSVKVITAGEPASFKKPFADFELKLDHTRYENFYQQEGCVSGRIHDGIVDLAAIFGYYHSDSSTFLPLVRDDDCNNKVTTYTDKTSGSYSIDFYIHKSCYYQDFIEQLYCNN